MRQAEPGGRKNAEAVGAASAAELKPAVAGASNVSGRPRVGTEVLELSSRGRKLAGRATGAVATDQSQGVAASSEEPAVSPEGIATKSRDVTAKPDSSPVKPEDWFRLYNANRTEEKAGPKGIKSVFEPKSADEAAVGAKRVKSVFETESSGNDASGLSDAKGVSDASSSGDDGSGARGVKNVFDTSTTGARDVTSEEGTLGEPKSSVQNKNPGGARLGKSVTGATSDKELSEQERQEVRELELRDREVRIHEEAHKAVGGGLAGAIDLSFEDGPDGKRYAVNGSVSIDVSSVKGDPEATLAKMRRVQAAAMAPVNPSGADQQIAARAAAKLAEALQEVAKKRFESMQQGAGGGESTSGLRLTA